MIENLTNALREAAFAIEAKLPVFRFATRPDPFAAERRWFSGIATTLPPMVMGPRVRGDDAW